MLKNFNLQIAETVWLSVFTIAAVAGFMLIILGTNASTGGRYLMPLQILPGVGALYLSAVLVSIAVVRANESTRTLKKIRVFVIKRIGGQMARERQRNMFLLLTICFAVLGSADGVTRMYSQLSMNYFVCLLINLIVSMIASFGLFGWLASLLISKQLEKQS